MKYKYHNQKTIVDGIEFDSKAEANRYRELKLLQKNGIIKHLELQPKFELQPSYKVGNKSIRAITYKADFSYYERNKHIVEDVKGMKTEVYKIKRKIFEYKYPDIVFKEVK